jgi:hypothetical protein
MRTMGVLESGSLECFSFRVTKHAHGQPSSIVCRDLETKHEKCEGRGAPLERLY